MKHFKTLAIVATIFLASTNASAQNKQWGHLKNHALQESDDPSQPALFTIYGYTDHDYTTQFSIQNYAGTSTTEPCSDLKPIGEPIKYGLRVEEIDIEFDNYDIIKNWGPAKTCIKADISVDGIIFSTGNIQLGWDGNGNAYTAATPDKIDMDFSSGDDKDGD
jgi:hypothetical protein